MSVNNSQSAFGSVDDINYIANILLIGNTVRSLFGELDLMPEMIGYLAKQIDPGPGFKLTAPHHRLQGERRFGRRNPLAQSGDQMRIVNQRVEFTAQDLVQIGLG